MAELGIKGKVSVVTGSARGIGRAVSEKLAEEGATLIITDIDEETAKSTANDIASKFSVDTLAFKHDVSSEDSTKEVVGKIVEKYSRIDILINNAGITKDSNHMIMPKSSWDMVIAINLTGAFFCTKFVSKRMLKQRSGRIVNIASVSGIMGNVGQANYSASKAGLIGLTKTTARELATRGITVNAIAPGYIQSDMTHVLSDEVLKKMTDMIPMKTYGTPEDVADAVLFFVSNKAKYVTGQVLNVDGGMVM
jgi:3-oxoacyl-[acyl-carrier protein] reductase